MTTTRVRNSSSRRSELTRITCTDGVELAVRDSGPTDAPIAVVLAHGFCLRMAAWRQQLTALEHDHPELRVITYDQRGHGASDTGAPERCTIEQLGRDLNSVLDAVDHAGPVVVVGHSMGGMTILSHAAQFPTQIGRRIHGAVLVSTAAQGLDVAGVLPGWNTPLVSMLRYAVWAVPQPATHLQRAALRAAALAIHAAKAGGLRLPQLANTVSEGVIGSAGFTTMAAFLGSLQHHDETAALPTLSRIPTIVVCGELDHLTPLRNSHLIACAIDSAQLVTCAGVGHMTPFDAPSAVTAAITAVVHQVHRTTVPTA